MNIFKKLISFFSSSQNSSKESVKQNVSLTISEDLKEFLENEVLEGLNISSNSFWMSFEKIINEFSPKNKNLLLKREEIQFQIDQWHLERRDTEHNQDEYKLFLENIGYIAPRSSPINPFSVKREYTESPTELFPF